MNTNTIILAVCIALCCAIAAACEYYKRRVPAAWQAAHPEITHAIAAVRAVMPNPIGLGLQLAAAFTGKTAIPAMMIAGAESAAAAAGTTTEEGAKSIAAIAGQAPLATFLLDQAKAVAAAYGTTQEMGAKAIAKTVARSVAPARDAEGVPLPRLSAPSLPRIDEEELTPREAPASVPSLPAIEVPVRK